MDITILLIVIIFVLLAVPVISTAIFVTLVWRKAEAAHWRAESAGDEQINIYKRLAELTDTVATLTAPQEKPAPDPMSREEQFARMMAMRPPTGLRLGEEDKQ